MSTLQEVYHQLCTEDRIPKTRQKDIMTALRYLAASHDSTPDRLTLTPEVEGTYNARLREYLTAQGKGHSTVRNAIQGFGQFLRAMHQLPPKAPLPQATPRRRRWKPARDAMAVASPYRHQAWLTYSKYVLPQEQWPAEVTEAYERFKRENRHRLRPASLQNYVVGLNSLLGYLRLTADERLDRLPPDARKKLELKRYADDLRLIRAAPQTVAWDDLVVVSHLESFVTWHAWRIHTPQDARVRERPPSTPSTLGVRVVETMIGLAETLQRPDDAKAIRGYRDTLRPPKKIHDKSADYHQFTFQELEDLAKALMHEARTMDTTTLWNGKGVVEYPGAFAALRFQLGLVVMMGWRVPIRVRNWCEALLDTNLRKVNGAWRWHFEGHELKIATRRGETNILDIEIDPDVVPYLEEYLTVWRPKLPHASEDRHVLLALRGEGGMLKPKDLYLKLKVHVYRLGGKRLFPHLLRSIFTSNMLSSGMDINSVAYGLNDNPATVLRAYNELQAGKHEQSLHDAYRRALNGSGNGSGH